MSRMRRSAPNVQGNSAIVPQSQVRASKAEGQSVLVTGGEYHGLSGKTFQCGFSETELITNRSVSFICILTL